MKKNILLTAVTALTAFVLALPVAAQSGKAPTVPTLKIGDPAPKLQVGKWMQGDPVKGFESGTTYIVEFWATWCGPCVATIPHVNDLQTKFKDKKLVVIGQNLGEDEAKVEPFIQKMGAKMTYRVTLDDMSKEQNGAMAKNWMDASGQEGIPVAFVVNKAGKVAWIGHPGGLKEKLVEDILADRYDLQKAVQESEKEAKEIAELKKNEAQIMEAGNKLGASMKAKKWGEADRAVTELEKLLPESQKMGLNIARFLILVGQTNYPAAYKLAGSVSDASPDNVRLQFTLAHTIAMSEDVKNRDLNIAEKAAERANKVTEGKEPGILDLLARIQFMNGKKKEAVVTQQKAVDLGETDDKEALQKTLASYKADKLPEPAK